MQVRKVTYSQENFGTCESFLKRANDSGFYHVTADTGRVCKSYAISRCQVKRLEVA